MLHATEDDRTHSIGVDRRIISLLQPGDVLNVAKTRGAGCGLSVLRDDELVVAAGAVLAVPLGPGVKVRLAPEIAKEAEAVFQRHDPQFILRVRPIEVFVNDAMRLLQLRSIADMGRYHVRVLREYNGWNDDACLAITWTEICLQIRSDSARRRNSAHLTESARHELPWRDATVTRAHLPRARTRRALAKFWPCNLSDTIRRWLPFENTSCNDDVVAQKFFSPYKRTMVYGRSLHATAKLDAAFGVSVS